MTWSGRLTQGFLIGAGLLSLFSCTSAAEGTPEKRATEIDLSDFEPSFTEEFDSLDVSEWGCLSKWIAHTPWAGDFGSARFMPPGDDSPFSIRDGILTIEARKTPNGRWVSGMLSAWDACNSGFAQKYGYFETRTRLTSAPGFWPSFWLIGVDKRHGTAEIDVFEFLTEDPGRYSLGVLKHPAKEGQSPINATTKAEIPAGLLSKQFNTFGVEITPKEIVFYLNRRETWRTPIREEFHQPMYPLLSFPADAGRMDASTPDRVTMEVDYVRAYQRKPIGF